MNDQPTLDDVIEFRLRQLRTEFDQTSKTFMEYELPFISGTSSPSVARLEGAERTLHRLIMIQASIETLLDLK